MQETVYTMSWCVCYAYEEDWRALLQMQTVASSPPIFVDRHSSAASLNEGVGHKALSSFRNHVTSLSVVL